MVATPAMEAVGDRDPEVVEMLARGFDIPSSMGRGGSVHDFWRRQLAEAKRLEAQSTSALPVSLPATPIATDILV